MVFTGIVSNLNDLYWYSMNLSNEIGPSNIFSSVQWLHYADSCFGIYQV